MMNHDCCIQGIQTYHHSVYHLLKLIKFSYQKQSLRHNLLLKIDDVIIYWITYKKMEVIWVQRVILRILSPQRVHMS